MNKIQQNVKAVTSWISDTILTKELVLKRNSLPLYHKTEHKNEKKKLIKYFEEERN